MTPQEAARHLDGGEYGKELTRAEEADLKEAGLVVVFGASDDLMEFRGAIHDEVGAWNGGEAHITPVGLFTSECEHDDCPYAEKERQKAAPITALWDTGGFSWKYETEIPHATFVIKDDGENYCEGIVFALADIGKPPVPAGTCNHDGVNSESLPDAT